MSSISSLSGARAAAPIDAGRAEQARPQAAPSLPPLALPADTVRISPEAQELLAREQAAARPAT